MNKLITILDKTHDELLGKLNDANCPEIYTEAVSHELCWLREDICKDAEGWTDVERLTNRHMARCMSDLEDARCPRMWIDASRRGFVEFRTLAKEAINEQRIAE